MSKRGLEDFVADERRKLEALRTECTTDEEFERRRDELGRETFDKMLNFNNHDEYENEMLSSAARHLSSVGMDSMLAAVQQVMGSGDSPFASFMQSMDQLVYSENPSATADDVAQVKRIVFAATASFDFNGAVQQEFVNGVPDDKKWLVKCARKFLP